MVQAEASRGAQVDDMASASSALRSFATHLRDEVGELDLRWALGSSLARLLPSGHFRILRALCYRLSGLDLDWRYTSLDGPIELRGTQKRRRLHIRATRTNPVYINVGLYVNASADVTIEPGVSIGPYVSLETTGHEVGPSSQRAMALLRKPIRVGAGSFLMSKAFVYPGVSIGKGCRVYPQSVVVKDTSPDSDWGGSPAERIRTHAP